MEGNPCERSQRRLPGRGELGAVYRRMQNRWLGRGNKADSRDHAATSTPGVCLLAGHSATPYQDTERREGWEERKEKEERKRKREKGMRK